MQLPDVHRRIQAFSALGEELGRTGKALFHGTTPATDLPAALTLYREALHSRSINPWFTPRETGRALIGLSHMLQPEKLNQWIARYPKIANSPSGQKTIMVIMAGNIPLVGFHDFLCVLVSGHLFYGKLSGQDDTLPVALARLLTTIEPRLQQQISFIRDPMSAIEAVIATGSDNTARYFTYHYGDIPHIIRKNRNAMAIITGKESKEELQKLGEDVFAYYGLGCRNVSHILVPAGYDFTELINAWQPFSYVRDNKTYVHNLNYCRATYTAEGTSFTDAGHCLIARSSQIASPVSVIHCSYYRDLSEAAQFVVNNQERLQCVVAGGGFRKDNVSVVPPGKSQQPEVWDYADGVDTMRFLLHW